jgi:AcrR family transcriptional regulator
VSTVGGDRRRSDATRNREAILAAGFEVLSGKPDDAGLAEIARFSGLTRTTVYAHIPTREDLLAEDAPVEQRLSELVNRGRREGASAGMCRCGGCSPSTSP